MTQVDRDRTAFDRKGGREGRDRVSLKKGGRELITPDGHEAADK